MFKNEKNSFNFLAAQRVNALHVAAFCKLCSQKNSNNSEAMCMITNSVILAYLKSPVPRRRNPSLILDSSRTYMVAAGSGTGGTAQKGSPGAGVAVPGDASEHCASTQSMHACSASADERSPAR